MQSLPLCVIDDKDLIYEGIATTLSVRLDTSLQDDKDLIYEGIATLGTSIQFSLIGSRTTKT